MNRLRKSLIVVEVALVFVAFVGLFRWIPESRAGEWAADHGISNLFRNAVSLIAFPMIVMAMTRKGFASFGLNFAELTPQIRLGLRGFTVVAMLLMVFPVLRFYYLDFARNWIAGVVLTGVFGVGGLLVARGTRSRPAVDRRECSAGQLAGFVAFFLLCFAAVYWIAPFSVLTARIIHAVIFIGLAEELLMRGYFQSRLNSVFGRPYAFFGVPFGVGLILTTILFGIAHVLLSSDVSQSWPWGLWTASFGLIVGFLREKSGGIVAPGIVHGGLLAIQTVFS